MDALLNYCTALRYLNPHGVAGKCYEPFWPADYHLIGKDILTTHSVYWTTLLMALELPLPRSIFATAGGSSRDTRCPRAWATWWIRTD